MAKGSVHIGTSTMNSFKEEWAHLRNLCVTFKTQYQERTGAPHITKFYNDMAKMYTYLHNGNMQKYDYYSKKIMAKLNEVLTNSMDENFVLFGFSCKGDKNWELNTDRCTMQLANMMQNIQLHHAVFMTLRHGSVSAEESDFIIIRAD